MNTNEEVYLCTRPRLAGRLMQAGYRGKVIANPWTPVWSAWEFPKTKPICEIVADYYQEIHEHIPQAVAEFLQQEEGGTE